MRTYFKTSIIIFFAGILTSFTFAQTFKLDAGNSSLTVDGTSSLHDWQIEAEAYNGGVSFSDIETASIDKLQVDVLVESLKSGKTTMDKNTYKALKTSKYPKILFSLTKTDKVKSLGNNKFEVMAYGDLTISGTKKNIPIKFLLEINENTITLTGEKAIKMTDFNVEPPKALFGTITTGDEITIKFKSIFE